MFQNLIPMLADKYRLIAPDYPAFGDSAVPSRSDFEYTHAHLSEAMEALIDKLGVRRFAMYVMDFGGRDFLLEGVSPTGRRALRKDGQGKNRCWVPPFSPWASGRMRPLGLTKDGIRSFVERRPAQFQGRWRRAVSKFEFRVAC
jgi:hypothetical protein